MFYKNADKRFCLMFNVFTKYSNSFGEDKNNKRIMHGFQKKLGRKYLFFYKCKKINTLNI